MNKEKIQTLKDEYERRISYIQNEGKTVWTKGEYILLQLNGQLLTYIKVVKDLEDLLK